MYAVLQILKQKNICRIVQIGSINDIFNEHELTEQTKIF